MGIQPILRYPGAKWNIAEWIISYLPPHEVYLEPYFGSGAVFFNKRPSKLETINDIDGDVINLFRILRDAPDELADAINKTPWARDEFLPLLGQKGTFAKTGDNLEDARRFLVRCWQAQGTRTSDRSGWRNDVQGRQRTNSAKVWKNVPERVWAISERLKDAQIENKPALTIIERYRYRNVLIYADPPYLLSTRKGRMYANEMADADHKELLELLQMHPGPVLLSGYANDLYDSFLVGWERKTHRAYAEKGQMREEVLWINPAAAKFAETLF